MIANFIEVSTFLEYQKNHSDAFALSILL